MNTHPFRIPAVRGRSAAPRLARSTLAALALGLAGAGLAHAANLSPLTRPGAPGMTSGRPVMHLAPPRISILGATATLQRNCYGPQPLFIAHVTLHNAGGPLEANHGLVSVSDTNPQLYHNQPLRLVSAGIELPAIGAYSNAVVTVPISSLAPYAGEVGAKQLTVRVMPTIYAGKPAFPQPPFYSLRVAVPRGFCARGIQ